jgi:hypothetical protein
MEVQGLLFLSFRFLSLWVVVGSVSGAEWNCSFPNTSGVYRLTTACTLNDEVKLSGDLSIAGQQYNYSEIAAQVRRGDIVAAKNFTIVSSAANKRHFLAEEYLGVTLTLKWLLLTGGAGGYGGSVRLQRGATLVATHCIFFSNEGITGGAIRAVYASLNVYNSSFIANKAPIGGALNIRHGNAILSNVVLAQNEAMYAGGGIYIYGDNDNVEVCH